MDLLEDPVYIGGTVNTLIRQDKRNKENYDIYVPIDTKKEEKSGIMNLSGTNSFKESRELYVMQHSNEKKGQFYYDYKEVPYHELDAQFMHSLVQRIRDFNDLDDEDLQEAFVNYTNLMIDLSFIAEDGPVQEKYDAKVIELLQIYEHRLKTLKRTALYNNLVCLK